MADCSSIDEQNIAKEELDEMSENDAEPVQKEEKPLNMSQSAVKLRSWLNKPLRIEMTDKRVLIGIFLCTDRDANVILGSCSEYLPEGETSVNEEPRMLGLIMVPGKHIVSISIDQFVEPILVPEISDDVIV